MKRLIFFLPALIVAGCVTTGGGSSSFLSQVQAITGPLCSVIPVAGQLLGIGGTAEEVADAICKVVNGLKTARYGAASRVGQTATINVRGQKVRVQFVR